MEQTFRVLLLSDGVAGHTRQLEAVLDQLKAVLGTVEPRFITVDVKFSRNLFEKSLFYLRHPHADSCRICDRCQRYYLSPQDHERLTSEKADLVLSPFGRRTADANRWLAARLGAKSVVMMTPRAGLQEFDLAIVPRHDQVPSYPNVLLTEGAPTRIDDGLLREEARKLESEIGPLSGRRIGLLLGGDYKTYRMDKQAIAALIDQLVEASSALNADLLVTTSRRTSPAIEQLLKERLSKNPCCKLLVVANEKNRPGTVPAILGLSQIVVVSPETVNMVSEAASSWARVLAFQAEGFISPKHRLFLENLQARGYITRPKISETASTIRALAVGGPKKDRLDDSARIRQAFEKLLAGRIGGERGRSSQAGSWPTTPTHANTANGRSA